MKERVNLASLILPEEVFEHFEIVATQADGREVHLYLDQKNHPPVKHDYTYTYTYTSKGFTEQTIIQDFPLHGIPVFLHIRRRKWLEQPTEQIITSQVELTRSGNRCATHITMCYSSKTWAQGSVWTKRACAIYHHHQQSRSRWQRIAHSDDQRNKEP